MKNKLLYFYQNISIAINFLLFKNFDEKYFIKSKIDDGNVIFDVGSNVGTYIRLVSKLNKNKSLKIYSFEPNNKLTKTQQKLKLNQKHKLNINNFAIHDKLKETKFYENAISSQSTTRDNYILGKIIDSYKVSCISIDLYCKKNLINNIDLLKIDTEGDDFNVLLSAKDMLADGKIKFIKIEIENTNDFKRIVNFLNGFNFRLIGILNQTYKSNELKLFDCYFKLFI